MDTRMGPGSSWMRLLQIYRDRYSHANGWYEGPNYRAVVKHDNWCPALKTRSMLSCACRAEITVGLEVSR